MSDTSDTTPTLTPSGSVDVPLGDRSDPQQRINALMSNWQKEQAATQRLSGEVERLRTQLADAVADLEGYRQREDAASEELRGELEDAKQQLKNAEKNLAEKEATLVKLTGEVTRLRYLMAKDNRDLLPYAGVFPESATQEELERIAENLRAASPRRKPAATTPPLGGQPSRAPAARERSPEDIRRYLAAATSEADLNARIAEVSPGRR